MHVAADVEGKEGKEVGPNAPPPFRSRGGPSFPLLGSFSLQPPCGTAGPALKRYGVSLTGSCQNFLTASERFFVNHGVLGLCLGILVTPR